jgi:hypothetical protein
VDFGQPVGVDEVRLSWVPHAAHFSIQYWRGGPDPFGVRNPHDAWHDFPQGAVTHGTGERALLRVAPAPVSVRMRAARDFERRRVVERGVGFEGGSQLGSQFGAATAVSGFARIAVDLHRSYTGGTVNRLSGS